MASDNNEQESKLDQVNEGQNVVQNGERIIVILYEMMVHARHH